MEALPSPLSSRPELRRSVVERSAVQRSFPGNGFCSATTLNGSTALSFVISTGAPKERSGEICGPAVLSWEYFSSATVLPGSAALPFVFATGAPKERSGEICGPAVLSWECFSSATALPGSAALPFVTSTGAPKQGPRDFETSTRLMVQWGMRYIGTHAVLRILNALV